MAVLLLLLLASAAALSAGQAPKGGANRTDVVWMVPSWVCNGASFIEVEKYGIRQNENQQFTNGSVFAIFYEHSFGKIPFYEKQNINKPKNGGLPQMGDLKAHLIEAEKNINETIPDEQFDGIAVIDIEEFRPMWELSWGLFAVYQTESIRLTRQQHPSWSMSVVREQAKKDYEKASREFFVETIRLGKRLRPLAKWGYYLFPKCNGNVGKTNSIRCSEKFQKFNDNLRWLWEESTALFPSIYLYNKTQFVPKYNLDHTGALILETQRIRNNYCPECEIHVFTKIEYNSYDYPEQFYSKQNLAATLDLSMKMNVNSVAIWSTSQRIKSRCGYIQSYVQNTLGPYLQLTTKILDKCREVRCGGHGECYLPTPRQNPEYYNYSCRCERPFYGPSCRFRSRRLGFSLPRPTSLDVSSNRYNALNQFYVGANGSSNSV